MEWTGKRPASLRLLPFAPPTYIHQFVGRLFGVAKSSYGVLLVRDFDHPKQPRKLQLPKSNAQLLGMDGGECNGASIEDFSEISKSLAQNLPLIVLHMISTGYCHTAVTVQQRNSAVNLLYHRCADLAWKKGPKGTKVMQ